MGVLLRAQLAEVHTLVVLGGVEGLIDAQTAVVALLVDAAVDGLVDANATALDAVVHVLVALVEDLLAAADAGLDLPRPGALPLQQLLDLLVRRA